jgi:hypothetical protein
LREHDIVDAFWINLCALNQRLDDQRTKRAGFET